MAVFRVTVFRVTVLRVAGVLRAGARSGVREFAGVALDQRNQQPRCGQGGQHGAFGFLAGRVGGEEGRETRIRPPVVPGDALAAGVQPSHGSDLTRYAGYAPPGAPDRQGRRTARKRRTARDAGRDAGPPERRRRRAAGGAGSAGPPEAPGRTGAAQPANRPGAPIANRPGAPIANRPGIHIANRPGIHIANRPGIPIRYGYGQRLFSWPDGGALRNCARRAPYHKIAANGAP